MDISDHPLLSTDLLPKTSEERKKMADDWNSRSTASNIFYGHLGAIDGWLCCTEMPHDVTNPSDYFSGHYQRFGLSFATQIFA